MLYPFSLQKPLKTPLFSLEEMFEGWHTTAHRGTRYVVAGVDNLTASDFGVLERC